MKSDPVGAVEFAVRRALVVAAAGALAFGASEARADLWVKQKITQGGKSAGERTWSISGQRVRVDQDGSGFVLDPSKGRAWLFAENGTFCNTVSMPKGSEPDLSGKEGHAFSASFRDPGTDRMFVRRRSESRTIAGVEADRYDVVLGAETIQERWAAPSLDWLDELITPWLGSGLLTKFSGFEEASILQQTMGAGFPLVVKNAKSGIVFEAIEVKTAALPAAAFNPPASCPER